MKEKEEGLFGKLSGLGLKGLDKLSLYNEDSKEDESAVKAVKQKSTVDYLFDRKVTCPVCTRHIHVRAVKTAGVRVISRDTDFMTYYEEPNPAYYDAWTCTHCGYAALSNRFNTISDRQVKLIRDNITSKWKGNKSYPPVYDVETAIETHQLALLNTVVKVGRDSEKAMTCLKLAWLFRLKKDQQSENKYLSQSLQGFINSYEKEHPPIAGLDEASLQYLIGELYRRLGDNPNALIWFGRVLTNRTAKEKVKDMARTQKDLIRDQGSV